MKLFLLLCTALTVVPFDSEGAFHDRKLLVSKFGGKTKTLPEVHQIRKQIRDQTLASVHALPTAVKSDLVHLADLALKDHYPVKTAYDYMEYFRNGNRFHYEGKLTQHRKRVATLLVGQLLDEEKNKTSAKYVNEIVNGVWMILEESTWCWPAHLGLQGTSDHLPTPGHNAIDLGAGEVAKFLGWVKLLLSEKFDHVSKVVNARIDFELKNRIFQDYLNTDRYWWEGFHSHEVNNWNIWVNGNILKSALFTLEDLVLFDRVLNKTLYSADYFLDGYGEDGGCDEGPAYWRQAGGRLIEYLESVEQIFPGAKEYFSTVKLIKSIGEYSYKMLIEKNWFVNFADAVPTITYPPSLLAKFGSLFGDDNLKHFSAYMLALHTDKNAYFHSLLEDLNEFLNYVNMHKEIESYKPVAPVSDLVWVPDLQVVNSRSKADAAAKFFVAAKAGNNHESHNHNDVGSFVLFQNGFPVLIDIGVGTYTAKTFSAQRYDLFYMQSQYHNCPTINGIQQKAGNEFNSHNVSFKESPNSAGFTFSADIAGAYPKDSHAKQWIRTIHFDRTTNQVQVDDQYVLDKFVAPQKLHFVTVEDIEVTKSDHGLVLTQANVNVLMEFDWKLFSSSVEVKSLENDHHLTNVWGENVKRITLTTNEQHKELNGHFTVRFSQSK